MEHFTGKLLGSKFRYLQGMSGYLFVLCTNRVLRPSSETLLFKHNGAFLHWSQLLFLFRPDK